MLIIVSMVLAVVGLLYLFQDHIIFIPPRYPAGTEARFHRPLARLDFTTADGRMTAFYAPPLENPKRLPAHVWMLYNGNAGAALGYDHWLGNFDASPDGFLLIDPPGYGYNEGHPSGDSIRRVSDGAIAALAAHFNVPEVNVQDRLNVLGVSMGAAMAIDFTATHPYVKGLIVAAAFTGLPDMARHRFFWPLNYLSRQYFDNRAGLKAIGSGANRPLIYLFHGTEDPIVPVGMGRELARENPWIHYSEIPGAEHNDILDASVAQIQAAMNDIERLENASPDPNSIAPRGTEQ